MIEYITRSLKKETTFLARKSIIFVHLIKKIIDLVNIMSSNLNVSPIINFKPKKRRNA